MRKWCGKIAVLVLTLLMSTAAMTTQAYAWEKEQQALNDVMEQGAPVEVELPGITKVVEGENTPKERFTFVLRGQDGAPMPEGAIASRYEVSRVGKGRLALGAITYYVPGTYVYTICEAEGENVNWTYDDTVYTLTVTVESSGDKLTARSVLEKDGAPVDRIVFTNIYEEVDLSEEITIIGQKTWVHGANPEGDRPDHIVVMVYADGTLIQQAQVTQASDWRYSFTLPKYSEAGKEIRYTVDEADVEGYTKKISGYDITNTYVPASSPVKPPKTGDDFPLELWLALLALGLCGFVFLLLRLRRPAYRGRRVQKEGKRLSEKKRRRE